MIINIIKYSRHKNTISYYFVGNQNNELKEILNILKIIKLNEKDNLLLKNHLMSILLKNG